MRLEFCINPDRRVEESDYTDNCRTFSAEQLRWVVTVRLDRIRVHADGNRASPGDWMVYLFARHGSGESGTLAGIGNAERGLRNDR